MNNLQNLTQNFCFRLDALRRRIVTLRNDLRAFKLGQKGMLNSVDYLILSPNGYSLGKWCNAEVEASQERPKGWLVIEVALPLILFSPPLITFPMI